MSKVLTIRLGEEEYNRIKAAAEADRRPMSNYMTHATLRFMDQIDLADEQEMSEIRADKALLRSLKSGSSDIRKGRYTIVRNRRNSRVS